MPLKEITMIFLVALREHLFDKTRKGMEVRVIWSRAIGKCGAACIGKCLGFRP